MQAGGRGAAKPPIGIAFEGDLEQRIDAVLAAAMLYGLAARSEARAIALCISRPNVRTAQFADIVAGFYTARPAGGFAMIGMPESGLAAGDSAAITTVLTKKAPDGAPLYTTNLSRVLDTADNAVLIRNQLLAQNDGNATIVVAGPLTGIARLLSLFGSRPQITAKVRQLVVAGGSFGTPAIDPSIAADAASARTVFAEWPTPIVVAGAELGAALPFPAASLDADFSWAPAHPVVDAYRAFKPMPYDAPTTALAALLYAVRPDQALFSVSDAGTIAVAADHRTTFAPAADGRHRFLAVDPARQEAVISAYRELVSARPAARPGRGGRGAAPATPPPAQQQQQQPNPQPPASPGPGAPAAKPPA